MCSLSSNYVKKNLRFRTKFRSFLDQKNDFFCQIFYGRTLLSSISRKKVENVEVLSKKKSAKGARGLEDVEVDKNLRFRTKFRQPIFPPNAAKCQKNVNKEVNKLSSKSTLRVFVF